MSKKSRPKILIADANPRVLKLLELRFSEQGFQVAAASSAKDAVVTAIILKPDLILSEWREADLGATEFCRAIRSVPDLAATPMILAVGEGSPPPELGDFKDVHTEWIRKPYSFEELFERVRARLNHARPQPLSDHETLSTRESRPSGRPAEGMTLLDILQVLAMNRKTCTVSISRPGEEGKIYFQQGRIVDAKARHLQGETALYELIGWPDADYSIGYEPFSSVEETITRDTRQLLAESFQRMNVATVTDRLEEPEIDKPDPEKTLDAGAGLHYTGQIHPLGEVGTALPEGLPAGDLVQAVDRLLRADQPLPEKLAGVLREMQQCFGGGHGHFYLLDSQSGTLTLRASTLYPAHLYGVLSVRTGEGIVGGAVDKGGVLLLQVARSTGARDGPALICVPLQKGSQTVGVLVFEQAEFAIRPDELVSLVEKIGGMLAATIVSELEKEQLTQRLRRLSIIQEKGLDLLSISDEAQLLNHAALSAATLLDAEVCIVRGFDKNGRRLAMRASYGLRSRADDGRLIELDGAVALRVFQTRQPEVIQDFSSWGHSIPKRFYYRHGLCHPLIFEDRCLGTLSVYNKLSADSYLPSPFNGYDLEALRQFSACLAKASVRVKTEQARATLITIDELTGLGNERYFMMRLPEEIRRAERHQRKLALIMVEAKDARRDEPLRAAERDRDVVRRMAEILEETFRNVDILVRLQDARFAALMPDTGENVVEVESRLARTLTAVPVRVYIGHSVYPIDGRTGQELIRKASSMVECRPPA